MKINIKDLENVLFDIFPTNKEKYEIKYVDFNYNQDEVLDIPEGVVKLSESTWNKTGDMKSLIIKKNVLNICDEKFDTRIVKTLLMEHMEMDFLKMSEHLGELNRIGKYSLPTDKYDINIPEFRKGDLVIKKMDENRVVLERFNETESISRRISPQIIRCGSLIATGGRIGPGQYLIMNKNTYEYLEQYFEILEYGFHKKEQFDKYYESCKFVERGGNINLEENVISKFHGINIITDDRLNNDVIIQGRKNGDYKIGITGLVWTNENGDVLYDDRNDEIEFGYNIIDVGFLPWTQFYTIHLIRDEN